MENQPAVIEKKLAKLFEGQEGVVAVYLFGSRVRGDTDRFRDFDLAVSQDSGQRWIYWVGRPGLY